MKRLVFATVLIIAALIIGSQLKAQEPTPAIPPIQCVRVLVEDRDGRSGGTGALVASDLVVTANHVVKDRKRNNECEILFPNWELVPGRVIGVDTKLDLALIRMNRSVSYRPYGFAKPAKVGTPLLVMGYGYGPFRADWGQLGTKTWGPWLQVVQARARSGDSGGPVVDALGRFHGTLWGSDKKGTMFTPADTVLKFMKKHVKIIEPMVPVNPYDPPNPNNPLGPHVPDNDLDDDNDYDLSRYWRRGRVRRFWNRMPSPFADSILRRAFA